MATNKYADDEDVKRFRETLPGLPTPVLDDLCKHIGNCSHALGTIGLLGVSGYIDVKRHLDAFAVVALAEQRKRRQT